MALLAVAPAAARTDRFIAAGCKIKPIVVATTTAAAATAAAAAESHSIPTSAKYTD